MTSIPSSTPDTTRNDLAAIVERDEKWRPEPDGSWTYLERGTWTEPMHVHTERAIEDRRVLIGLLREAREAVVEWMVATARSDRLPDWQAIAEAKYDRLADLLSRLSILDDTTRNDR